ncbi:dihydrolipoamide acetyltransferase family protein [Streptomyces sp. NPDC051677]|uniref:dihydrolipoamide acetyltransferase family protein n=1 Tax=Streptomyces sp. NPDC051677 TaxID=3365669 RepID=UPI0037D7B9B8
MADSATAAGLPHTTAGTYAGADVQYFRLPDPGEGLTEAEVVSWHVGVGDTVEVNQPLVEIETAKSLVELPSPYAGEVVEVLVQAGQTALVGDVLVGIRPAADEATFRPLVGYGPPAHAPAGRRRRPAPEPPPAPAAPFATTGPTASSSPPAQMATDAADRPRAKPPVRLLAKRLGVDLRAVKPSGPDGRITRDDVHAAAAVGSPASLAVTGPARPAADTPRPDGQPGEVRIPVKGVRKQTALAMVASAFTAPHVTEFVTVDMTRTLDLRSALLRRSPFRDMKLTPLAFVARAFLHALGRTPDANSRWDEPNQQIVVLPEVNLGIAAATPRGLLVPNIKSAQRLGLADLTRAIDDLAQTARAGRTPPAALSGGTVTITNVGVFGVDTGTPILNPGETAILAVGAVRRTPWVVGDGFDERIEPRSVVQLALSFDHRVMDGQQGSQLLADTADLLREPGLALL